MARIFERQADVRAVLSMLEAGARVVTLWGPAGVGKTRLARECLRQPHGFDAAWFVDLSAAVDWTGVAAAVSRAIGLVLQPQSDDHCAAQIGRALSARGRVLLVLDNFEQVAAAAGPHVGTCCDLAVHAAFLVTSREPVGLGDEVIHEVHTLSPGAACELFAERAAAAGRPVRSEDRALIEQTVRQLDCLPLAVELAAAQVPMLGVAELWSRLRHLDLLDSGRRDVSDRQRTVRGALAWSWRLMSDSERHALAQCSVFRGGFTLAAAEAIVIDDGSSPDTVARLRALHRRALIQSRVSDTGEVRYSLLFTVREFAAEHLPRGASAAEPGRAWPAARARHAAYYAAVAEDWAARAHGAERAAVLRALALERDNLLEAHAHALSEDASLAIRTSLALSPMLLAYGPVGLLRRLLDEALGAPCDSRPVAARTLARAYQARAQAARAMGDSAAAFADLERALALARQDLDAHGEASVRCDLGLLIATNGQCAEATVHLEAALALAIRADDGALQAATLTNLGFTMWYAGRLAAADDFYQRALPLARGIGDIALEAQLLSHVGSLAYERGALEAFVASTRAARELALRAGEHRHVAKLTMSLALGAAELGHRDDADRLFEACLTMMREAGDVVGEGHCLANVGWEDMRFGRGSGRAHFERALALLDRAHIGWADGLVRATLAGIAASEDRLDDARALIADAERHMADVADVRLHDTARMHYAHLDLALARRAEADGDAARATKLRAAVRALLAREPTDPESGRSDARLARLVLERALAGEAPRAATAPPTALASSPHALLVARDASAFRPPGGDWVDLSRRKSLRRILAALVGSAELTTEELLAAGWPGERVSAQAGCARVHVAISTLRRLGLGAMLAHGATGYRLDRRVLLVADVQVANLFATAG